MEPRDIVRLASPAARALCGVNKATWSRWARGQSRVPAAVLALLRIITRGELPQGSTGWDGWRFHDGKLYDPAGIAYTPGTIQAWHWLRGQLADMRATENRETPEPDELPGNVRPLKGYRRVHALSRELWRRLDDQGI